MSGSEVAKAYRRELRQASVEPPAMAMVSMACTGCGRTTIMLRDEVRGPRVRRCDACEARNVGGCRT